MYCSKQSSLVILITNATIVTLSFLLVHFLWYDIKDMSSFVWDWKQFCITAILGIVYAHFYNKMSRGWRYSSSRGFLTFKNPEGSHFCGVNLPNLANGLVFGLFVAAIICLAMALADFFISTLYIYILDGIRGAVPPEVGYSGAIGTQVLAATTTMEVFGKTEDQPRG